MFLFRTVFKLPSSLPFRLGSTAAVYCKFESVDCRSWGRWQGNAHAITKGYPLDMKWEHTSYLEIRALNNGFDSGYWRVLHRSLWEFHWLSSAGLSQQGCETWSPRSERKNDLEFRPKSQLPRFYTRALLLCISSEQILYFLWHLISPAV